LDVNIGLKFVRFPGNRQDFSSIVEEGRKETSPEICQAEVQVSCHNLDSMKENCQLRCALAIFSLFQRVKILDSGNMYTFEHKEALE